MLPKFPDRDYSKAYETPIGNIHENGFQLYGGVNIDFLKGYEAIPSINGNPNASKASNFKYWQKHPLIGWRLHNFKHGGILKGQKGLGKLTKSTVRQLFKEKPILRSIGSTEDYLRYYDTIFPKSVIQTPYTHGTTYDLSKGLYLTKPIPVTAAPETIKRSDLYLTLQPEAGLQYIPGINSLPNYS